LEGGVQFEVRLSTARGRFAEQEDFRLVQGGVLMATGSENFPKVVVNRRVIVNDQDAVIGLRHQSIHAASFI
jgi:hypothetical protein